MQAYLDEAYATEKLRAWANAQIEAGGWIF